MAFFRDEPTLLTRVQWYFVPSTNPQLALDNHFYSRIWERDEDIPDPIGEQYRPHPWRGGLPPHQVSVGGLCGTPDQWANGCLASDPIPANWPGTPIPVCCQPPPPVMLGGVGIGGKLVASASAGVSGCDACPVAPTTWKAVVSGVTDAMCPRGTCATVINGVHYLTWTVACTWETSADLGGCDFPGGYAMFLNYFGGEWSFNLTSDFGSIPLISGPFNCLGTNVFSGGSSQATCSGTATVTITPG